MSSLAEAPTASSPPIVRYFAEYLRMVGCLTRLDGGSGARRQMGAHALALSRRQGCGRSVLEWTTLRQSVFGYLRPRDWHDFLAVTARSVNPDEGRVRGWSYWLPSNLDMVASPFAEMSC